MEHIVHEMHHLNDVCVFEILYMIEGKFRFGIGKLIVLCLVTVVRSINIHEN